MKFSNAAGILVAVVLVFNQFFTYPVFAQEFSVTGNGEGSSNSISYQAEQNNQIQQSNDADIENNVAAEAQTGDNQANDNLGDVEIDTGDVTEEVTIVNSGNSQTAEIGCCPSEDPSSASIEGNGEDSGNSIDISDDSLAQVNIVNELKLKNNVSINSNTGDNEADDNDGEVIIRTGEVNLLAQILNQNLNSADVSVSNPGNDFNYSIKNNGSGSINSISEDNNAENEYFVFNDLYLVNDIRNYSNTGGNKANKNNGKVFISTGDVFLDIILKNKDINSSKIVDTCCAKVSPSPSPTPSGSPSPSPSPSPSGSPSPSPSGSPTSSCCSPTTDIPGPGGGGGGPGGGGEVLGASLPATGGFSLWTLTFLALLMLVSGVILRSDFTYAQTKFKKISRKFIDSSKSYVFGAYLLANLKVIPSGKA